MNRNLLLLVLTFVGLAGLGCGTRSANTWDAGMNHDSTMTSNHNGLTHGPAGHANMESSPNASIAAYDLQFIDTMIMHHEGAVDIAGPTRDKAHHAELLTMANGIVSSRTKEIERMKAWREKWFPGSPRAINIDLPGMRDSMKEMDFKQIAMLFGNDYDLEFLKQMIPHHEGAVIMANEALQRSSRPEIKTIATAIIKAQEAEMKQMTEWQAAWTK